MTTGRINQVTIPQRTRTLAEMLRELSCVRLHSKDASILFVSFQLGSRSATERTGSVQPCHGNPLCLCLVFRPLRPCKLQAYRCDLQVKGMPRRYLGEKVSSEHWLLSLAKGQHVQRPSILRLSGGDNFASHFSHFLPLTE